MEPNMTKSPWAKLNTPDALKNVLETINDIKTGNEQIITVVGCGGDRDKAKRPIMGCLASHLSTQVIFTSDNPRSEDPQVILEAIDPSKDADGLHPMNLGRLVAGYDAPLPCTPRGIVALLQHYNVALKGAEVTVIGRGLTVGRPLGLLLTRRQENATVTLTHTGTKDLTLHTRNADIVVAAIGQAHFLNASMIKEGAAIIDVGISRTDAGLLGDVHPDVMEKAGFVAPMPGGVGPMTRAMLVTNVVDACS